MVALATMANPAPLPSPNTASPLSRSVLDQSLELSGKAQAQSSAQRPTKPIVYERTTPWSTRTPSPPLLSGNSQAPNPVLRHKSSRTWHAGMSEAVSAQANTPPLDNATSRQNTTPSPLLRASSLSEAMTQQQKPSLMRRVSQKAANKLRKRTSSSTYDKDERSGPVTMRHRSGSMNRNPGTDNNRLGIQHRDSPEDEDDGVAVTDQFDHSEEAGALQSDTSSKQRARHEASDLVVPEELVHGTTMTRVTRKKGVARMFKLDVNKARVSWDPSKPTSQFYIDDLKDIRMGANARNYREELQISAESEDRWITITYADSEREGKLKLLHVIAPNIELFKLWTTTLESIHTYRTEMMAGLTMQGEKFVDAHWKSYMATQRQTSGNKGAPIAERLTFDDVERICRRLHINCSRTYLKSKFHRADRDGTGYLNFGEFRQFVQLLKERVEIGELWSNLVKDPRSGMTLDEFSEFLRTVQGVRVEEDQAQVEKVFKKFCRQSSKVYEDGMRLLHAQDAECKGMAREAFTDFLLSSTYNPALVTSPPESKLDRPLNEYFCSSSHNTYLMGRQVRGESSVEGYIRVLQRGCRCVEIDCWDGVDGRPVVTHGHTGTTVILFADVVSAIAKYAFTASPYPVILSLEVHCSLEQQVKMAGLLKSILGDALVDEPFMRYSFVLPSPEDLKNKVLVKVKGASERMSTDITVMDKGGGLVKSSRGFQSSSSSTMTSESEDLSSGTGEAKTEKKPSAKIAPELGALGVYCRGQKFRNFALPESKTFNHIFSFQEKTFHKTCKDPDKKTQLEKHNVRYLMRVYPSGFRVSSSNFDPLGFWRRGVQMVALNWQTYDLGLQLNDAMFAAGSDKSGYVLKPPALRGSRTAFDLPQDAAKIKKEKNIVSFHIDVISAQQLPRPKDKKADESLDPFVEVEVFTADDKMKGTSSGESGNDSKGVTGLGAPQKRRTSVVRDDGFHPLFQEQMRFKVTTKFEDLIFVRFTIYNADGDGDKTMIAVYTAKLSSLQQGYRHLPLFDAQGEQYLFSTLFVKIDVKPVTPDDDDVPLKASTMESIRTTARSVLSGRFSSDRRSVRRGKDVKHLGKNPQPVPHSENSS